MESLGKGVGARPAPLEREWPAGGGEMGARIRAHRWAATGLGPIEAWPRSIRAAVELMLGMRQPVCLWWGAEPRLLYNDEYLPILGDKHPEALGRTMAEVWPELVGAVEHPLDAVRARGPQLLTDREFALAAGDGRQSRWFTSTWTPLHDETGAAIGAFNASIETTDRVLAERALRASEERYRALFSSMDEAYAVVDVIPDDAGGWRDFRFVEVNPAFRAHTGMPDPVGRTATELLGAPNPRWAEVYGRVAETGEPVRFEEAELTLGRVFDLNVFRLGGPGSRRVAVLFTNVTARKRAEEALRASEARFRSFAESSADTLWIVDAATGRLEYLSPAFERMWGEPRDAVLRDLGRWAALIHPEDRARAAGFMPRALAGETVVVDYRIVRPSDGATRWIRDTGFPIRDEREGVARVARVARVAGIAQDITDHQESEERQAFLLRLSDALRPLADSVAIQDTATHTLGAHLDVDRTYYVEIDDARGVAVVARDYVRGAVPSLIGEHPLAPFGAMLAVIRAGQPFVAADAEADPTLEADRADYRARALRAFVSVPLIKDGALVAAMCVTSAAPRRWTEGEVALVAETAERTWAALERGRAEAALRKAHATLERRVAERTAELATTVGRLRESEDRFRALVQASSDVLYTMGPDWSEMRELRGGGFLADTARPSHDWLEHYIHPDDRPRVLAAIREAVRTRGVFALEHRVRRADGSEGWALSRAVPRTGPGGEIVEWFGTASDITARKRAEESLREREARLRLLLEQMPAALWTTDTDLRIITLVGAAVPASARAAVGQAMPAFLAANAGNAGGIVAAVDAHRRALDGTPAGLRRRPRRTPTRATSSPCATRRGRSSV